MVDDHGLAAGVEEGDAFARAALRRTHPVASRPAFRLSSLASRVVVSWGWRRALIGVTAGASSVLAMAPFHLAPVLFLSLPVLVWLLDGAGGATRWASARAAALAGWWFGLGYFLVGLHWIGEAFLVEREVFGWLMPFAVAGLGGGLAIFTGLGCALAKLMWSPGPARIAALAAGLGASEWLRGHVLTGFPWNAFGQAFSATDATAQAAAVFGLHGLTFLAVAICASPAALVGAGGAARRWVPALGLAALVAIAGGGALRLSLAEPATVPGVRLRLVQPNIDQREKFRPELADEVMATLIKLSRRGPEGTDAGFAGVTHLIWPESAFPFLLAQDAEALGQLADLLPIGMTLLTGAARGEQAPGDERARYHNSLYVINDEGEIAATYDKVHLVPFGEYLPFQPLLERIGLRQLTKVRGGFEAGPRRVALPLLDAPAVGPLICYEIIFPGEATPDAERPGWLVNVTNDAWFGRSIGPHQHLDQARLRAVEEGLGLARVANTGISALIDPYGRVLDALPLETEGVIDASLPQALPATPFARLGWAMPAGLLAAALLAALAGLRRRRFDAVAGET